VYYCLLRLLDPVKINRTDEKCIYIYILCRLLVIYKQSYDLHVFTVIRRKINQAQVYCYTNKTLDAMKKIDVRTIG